MAQQSLLVWPLAHSEPPRLSTYRSLDPPSNPIGPRRRLLREMVQRSTHAPSCERVCRFRSYNETQKAFLLVADPKAVDQRATLVLLSQVAVVSGRLDRERPVGTSARHLPGSIRRRSSTPRFLCGILPAQAHSSR